MPLENDFGTSYSGLTLDAALTNSVNTWFAQVGEQVGEDTLFEYMDRFGFNTKPAIDLPVRPGLRRAASSTKRANCSAPTTRSTSPASRSARSACSVTPLQMAEVAAAVANGGRLMKPQIWSRVVDPDGRVTKRLDPSEYSQPISEETAAELTTAMEGVVSEGTGTNAAIPGVPVAGKTGTAETPGNEACGGGDDENQAWFIGFAPADDPKIAIAASVECTEQFGNDVAAPIFRDVAETILNGNEMRHGQEPKEAATWPEVSEGSVVDGRYRVLRKIGSGGMADVWLAEDTHLQRQVALKVLHAASPRTANSSSASAARPSRRPASSTPTSSPSSTAARSTAPTTSRCSTWRAAR